MTAPLTTAGTTAGTTETTRTAPTATARPLVHNTLAHGNVPANAAPFTTTRTCVDLPSTRATRSSALAHHPGRDTRADILDAASCLVADAGFAAATTRHIAELTGVASGAVVNIFGGEDALAVAVYQRLAAPEFAAVDHAVRTAGDTAVADGTAGAATAQLTALVRTFATRAVQGRPTAEALMYEPVGARVTQERLTWRRKYHGLVVGIVAGGVAGGELPDQNPATTARAVTGAVVESLLGRLSTTVPVAGDGVLGEDASPLIDEVTALVLRLVGSPPPGLTA